MATKIFFYVLNFHVILFHCYYSTSFICSWSLIWYLETNLFLLTSLLFVIPSSWYNTMRIFSEKKEKILLSCLNQKLIQCEKFNKLFVIFMACLVLSGAISLWLNGNFHTWCGRILFPFSHLFLSAFLIHTITAMSLNLIKIIAIWKAVSKTFFYVLMHRCCVWIKIEFYLIYLE